MAFLFRRNFLRIIELVVDTIPACCTAGAVARILEEERGIAQAPYRGALPPQLFANSNTLTVTISEVHVDVNIIWSHIQSQYCRSTTACINPFPSVYVIRKVTSPPPPQLSDGNYPPAISPLALATASTAWGVLVVDTGRSTIASTEC